MRSGLFGLVFTVCILGQSLASSPSPGRIGLDAGGGMRISAEDRCPVCAMLPVRYPRFATAIELRDGRTYYFCSAGCMLNAWQHPDIFLGIAKELLGRPVVREYLSGEVMDAREVFWVSGSDVVGPMGPALVPLKNARHLEAFRKRHGAKHVFRLDELTYDNWQELTGKGRSPR
jgi:nitrous oxide reductase accessory protein NosL